MNELSIADKWIYQTLTSDSVLAPLIDKRVCSDLAPPGTAYPYVVAQLLNPDDLAATGAIRVWIDCLFLIKAVDETASYNGKLKQIADRFDVLLHKKTADLSYGRIVASYRERPFRMPEQRLDKSFRHLGGQFRLLVQAPQQS